VYNVSSNPYSEIVCFANSMTGWCSDINGYIYKTTNGGINWINNYFIPNYDFASIFFINSYTGWIGGAPGSIIKTTNGGESWFQQFSDANLIYSIFFLDSLNGYAGTGCGSFYKTTNGGNNWIAMNNSSCGYFNSLFFLNYNTGWVVGNWTINETINSGNNWTVLNNSYLERYDITFLNQNTGYYSAFYTYSNPQVTINESQIFKTSDGGYNWTLRYSFNNSNGLYSINFINDTIGWSSGYSGLLVKTTNSGLNWFLLSSNTTQNINCVKFVSVDIGFCSTNGGNILKTINGGNNWKLQNLGIFSPLYSISMVNPLTGWICGGNGNIYKTSNSGDNWILQNSGITSNLYSIFFCNLNTGWACGDNSIVKTLNGGITWRKDADCSPLIFKSIYFIDANTGWCLDSRGLILKTTTGGSSWILHNNNIIPDNFSLSQNYPNPFNPTTKIKFDIPENVKRKTFDVKLIVYDILGKEITTLVNESLQPGAYEVTFDGSNLPSGIYFYQLRVGDPELSGQVFVESKKMLIIK
jgi:photosystem II stability/assembly factor-like uncharacterized protein